MGQRGHSLYASQKRAGKDLARSVFGEILCERFCLEDAFVTDRSLVVRPGPIGSVPGMGMANDVDHVVLKVDCSKATAGISSARATAGRRKDFATSPPQLTEYLNPVVAEVDDVDPTVWCYVEIRRPLELAATHSLPAERGEKISVLTEDLDPVVLEVRDVNMTRAVRCNPGRNSKRPQPRPGKAEA